MKRFILASLVALSATGAAYADDYPYLAFEKADGSLVTFNSTGISITYQDGKLIVSDGKNNQEIEASSLSRMFFSTTQTNAIESSCLNPDTGPIDAYSLSGIYIGTFANSQALKQKLPAGVYLIKTQSSTSKIVVR